MKGHASLLLLKKRKYFLDLCFNCDVLQNHLVKDLRLYPLQDLTKSLQEFNQTYLDRFLLFLCFGIFGNQPDEDIAVEHRPSLQLSGGFLIGLIFQKPSD